VKPTKTTAATTKPTTDILSNVKPTRTTAATAKPQTATSGTSVPQVAQGTGQGNRIAAQRKPADGPWGSTKPPEVKASTRLAPSGTFAANLQRARQTAQSGRVGGSTVGATQQAAKLASRSKLAQTAQSGRVGGSTVGATQQAAKLAVRQSVSATAKDIRAGAGRVATGAVNAVKKYPKLAAGAAAGAALGGFAATQSNKPPETQAGTSTSPTAAKPSTAADNPVVSKTTTNPVEPKTFKDAFAAARKAAAEKGSTSTGKFKFKGKEYQTNTRGEKYVAASKQTDVTPKPTTTTSVTGGQGIAGISSTSTNKPVAKPSLQPGTTVGVSGNSVPPSADSKWQKGPDTRFNPRYNYGNLKPGGLNPTDQRDVRSPSNPERVANPTFVPQRATDRKSVEVGQEISYAKDKASRVDAKAQGSAPNGIASRPTTGIGPQQAPKPATPTPDAINKLGRVSQKPITGGAGS